MRYILDNLGYIEAISCTHIECNNKSCQEYTGAIPDGYSSFAEWAEKANIRAYKIVDNNLVFDAIRDAELKEQWEQENEDADIIDFDIAEYIKKSEVSAVGKSGEYNDLLHKPSLVSAFENDLGYLTTENDPTVPNHVKNISSSDITSWNGKQDELVSGTNIKTINGTTILGSGDIDIPSGKDGVGIDTITNYYLASETATSGAIEWDGNTTGKEFINMEGGLYYKVTDEVTTIEEMIGKKIAIYDSTSPAPLEYVLTSRDCVDFGNGMCMALFDGEMPVMLVVNATTGATPYSTGAYFLKMEMGTNLMYVSSFSLGGGISIDTEGWTETPQTITSTKKYLWNYERITYTDNTSFTSEPHIIGVYGDTGATGANGNDGANGTSIWTTTTAPTTPNYTFTISNLTGGNGTPIKVGDIIKYSYYMYTITSVSATTVLAPTRVSIRGSTGATGSAGTNGEDGVGIASVEETSTSVSDGGTNVITVTKTDGTTSTFTVKNGSKGSAGTNGTNGTNGKDGVSCTHSWNGTTLSVTSASGTSSANLKGDKGDKGDTGSNGTNGTNGVSCTHSWSGTTLSVTSASGTSSANLKGDKGDKGDTGEAGKDAKVYYGTCTTSAGTQAKVVTSDGFVLETGAKISVKFTNGQTYNGTATLNVNGTGAINICRVGTTTTTRYYWSAGEVVDFVYDGTNYVMEGKGVATTTYYGVTKLSSSTSSTSTSLAATPSAVKAAYDLANTANTQATTNATAITNKQDTLVSGTNIKTINGESLLGEGDITISGGGSPEAVVLYDNSSGKNGLFSLTEIPGNFSYIDIFYKCAAGDSYVGIRRCDIANTTLSSIALDLTYTRYSSSDDTNYKYQAIATLGTGTLSIFNVGVTITETATTTTFTETNPIYVTKVIGYR